MNLPIDAHDAPESEQERLERGVKQIVTSRERTPRDPRWHRAWWRTLVRYNRRLADLRQQEMDGDPPGDQELLDK